MKPDNSNVNIILTSLYNGNCKVIHDFYTSDSEIFKAIYLYNYLKPFIFRQEKVNISFGIEPN